jgi:Spy/CpxP family protein refolding chaperone
MTRIANIEIGSRRKPHAQVMRNAGPALFALLGLAVLLVAAPGRANAQAIDPLTDFLSGGTPEDAFLPLPPQLALEPDGQSPELADLPQPGPEGAPQRIQIEERAITGGPEEGGEEPGSGPARNRPMLKIEDQRKLADLRIKFLKQSGPLESDLKVKAAELAALWLDDEPNEDKIIAKAREIDKVKEQLQELRLRNRIAVLKILPPELRRMFANPGARGIGARRLGARAGVRGFGGRARQF